MHFKKIVAISFFLLCTGCATDQGNSTYAYDNEIYNTPENQYKIGYRYLLGQGRPVNYSEALRYFHKAAEEGNRFAQNELGYLYAAGKGVHRNYKTAIVWYSKAADQNVASAQYSLGILYSKGLGTAVDKDKATELFQKSANQGFGPAKLALVK